MDPGSHPLGFVCSRSFSYILTHGGVLLSPRPLFLRVSRPATCESPDLLSPSVSGPPSPLTHLLSLLLMLVLPMMLMLRSFRSSFFFSLVKSVRLCVRVFMIIVLQ